MVEKTAKIRGILEKLSILPKDILIDSLVLQEKLKYVFDDAQDIYEYISEGYDASNVMTIKIKDMSLVGKIVNAIVKAGGRILFHYFILR